MLKEVKKITGVIVLRKSLLLILMLAAFQSVLYTQDFAKVHSLITEGIDAQAEVHVTVENNDTGTIFNANGLDFDVLRASAIAYANANTLVQRENAGIITRKISEKANPED